MHRLDDELRLPALSVVFLPLFVSVVQATLRLHGYRSAHNSFPLRRELCFQHLHSGEQGARALPEDCRQPGVVERLDFTLNSPLL